MCAQCMLDREKIGGGRSVVGDDDADHGSLCAGEGGMMIGVFAGGRMVTVVDDVPVGGGIKYCCTACVQGHVAGDDARPERCKSGADLVTRRNISMSRGHVGPERSSHSRIVSAEDCWVVIKRICGIHL